MVGWSNIVSGIQFISGLILTDFWPISGRFLSPVAPCRHVACISYAPCASDADGLPAIRWVACNSMGCLQSDAVPDAHLV